MAKLTKCIWNQQFSHQKKKCYEYCKRKSKSFNLRRDIKFHTLRDIIYYVVVLCQPKIISGNIMDLKYDNYDNDSQLFIKILNYRQRKFNQKTTS